MRRVYCSGPIFCPEEIAGMSAIAQVLERAGHQTYLPQRDGLEGLVLGMLHGPLGIDVLGSRERIDRAIFALDAYQIVEGCDCLVFNMNGRVPDEGAAVEAGIAFAVGKPVLLYKNDRRTAFRGRDNSMLLGLSPIALQSDLGRLPAALENACAALEGRDPSEQARARVPLSDSLHRAVAGGEKLWRVISVMRAGSRRLDDDRELVQQILASIPQEPMTS